MGEYLGALRQFSRNMRLYVIYTAFIAFGYAGVFMLLINLYLLRLGYGIEFVGIFGGAGLLTLAVGAVPATIIGDRLGSRRTLIVAQVIVIAGSALVLVNESLPPGLRPSWLLLTYVTTWIGGALYVVNNAPFMMANTSPRERNHAFAVTNAILPLAAFCGAIIGGMLPSLLSGPLRVSLDHPAPYRIALWLSILCYLLSLLVLLRTNEGEQVQPVAAAGSAGAPDRAVSAGRFPYALVAVMMAILLFKMLGEAAVGGFSTVYLDTELHTPTSLIGLVSALPRLLAVPAALAAPMFIQRLGLGRTFLLSVLLTSASMLPLALVANIPAATIGMMGVYITGAISATSLMLFHQQAVRPEWRTAMSGGVSMAQGVSQAIVSMAGGFVIAAWGFHNFFLSSAALTLVAVGLFWAYFRNPARAAAPEPEIFEVALEPETAAVQ